MGKNKVCLYRSFYGSFIFKIPEKSVRKNGYIEYPLTGDGGGPFLPEGRILDDHIDGKCYMQGMHGQLSDVDGHIDVTMDQHYFGEDHTKVLNDIIEGIKLAFPYITSFEEEKDGL